MKNIPADIDDKAPIKAFNKQALFFDQLYSNNSIIRYKRKRVRDHIKKFLQPGSEMLEINAGTGEDAIFFAKEGYRVHATDGSQKMYETLLKKVKESHLESNISSEICSFTELENLQQQGPYDYIFSNFAGLNCTAELDKVLASFTYLLRAGGFVTLVILPKFCLWEFLLLFKGKFKTAFRRFSGSKGAKAHIEGEYFQCWYYNPSFVRKQLKNEFNVISLEGLCTIVPPSYIENFAEKHPKWFRFLEKKENKWKNKWPWRMMGDYYIITLQKK